MFDNLRRALLPLMDKGVGDTCRGFGEMVVDRGRRRNEIMKGGRGKVQDGGIVVGGGGGEGMEKFSDEELERELEKRRRERAAEVLGSDKKAEKGGAFCNVDGTCEMFE